MAPEPQPSPHDRGWQRVIQWVLRGGLAAASALIAAGLFMAVAGDRLESHAVRLRLPFSEGSVAERVIALGVLVLAITPVLRVAALIGVWLWERDYKFALLGLIVLVVLLASALSGSG